MLSVPRLVGYIHLNPLRAGLVGPQEELERYSWSSQAAIDWFDREFVLQHFGLREYAAMQAYLEYFGDEMGEEREEELSGGGLILSHGGWSNVQSMRKQGVLELGDARVLGSGEFVSSLLEEAEASVRQQVCGSNRLELVRQDIETACREQGISVVRLLSGRRKEPLPELRKQLARKFVEEYRVWIFVPKQRVNLA